MRYRITHVNELPTIYLKPGEIHFSNEPARVVTVLGSCISVVMYDRRTRVGAICHAVMPSISYGTVKKSAAGNDFQYVDTSMKWMLEKFAELGIKAKDLEVKIFGGSEIFYDTKYNSTVSIGSKNIEAAMKFIQKLDLKLKAWNVGGSKGRKLIFYTDTGEVFTKFVEKMETGLDARQSERGK